MSTSAVVMMVVSALVIWGGLAVSVVSLLRHGHADDDVQVHRDL